MVNMHSITGLLHESTAIVHTTVTSSTEIYGLWCADQTASTISTITNDSVWHHFVTTSGTGTSIASFSSNSVLLNNENRLDCLQDLQAERQRLARQAEARRIEKQRKRREAEARAEILLKQSLTPAQKAQLKRFGYFFVEGNKTGRRYRIRNGRSLNVDIMQGNKVTARLCAHPSDDVPNMDTMLVQKIYLECMEDEFLRIANRQ